MIYTVRQCEEASTLYRKLSRLHIIAGNYLEANYCKVQEIWFMDQAAKLQSEAEHRKEATT